MASRLEQLAEAVFTRHSLEARSLVQEMVRSGLSRELVEPAAGDPPLRVIAAALAELLAERHGLPVPAWTTEIGPLPQPFFAVERALRWPSLREQCERETPGPLRRRGIFAPAGFLAYA